MRGWPSRTVLMLAEDMQTRQAAVQGLQQDFKLFQLLAQQVEEGSAPKYLLDRSIFHLRPVQQAVEILRSSGWQITDSVSTWLRSFHSRSLGSQICEDGLKDCRQVEHDNENRKASAKTLLDKLTQGTTIAQRHQYDEPRVCNAQVMRGAHLPAGAFKASAKTASHDFAGVKGASASTAWFSPSAERMALPFADTCS